MPDGHGRTTPADPLDGLDLAPVVWSSTALVVATCDGNGRLLHANETLERLAGRDPRGEPLIQMVGEGQSEAFEAWLTGCGSTWVVGTWGMLPGVDGMPRDVRLSACRGPDGGFAVIGEQLATDDVAASLLDVNQTLVGDNRRLDRERIRLDKVARQDALTGVATRRAFDDRLAFEVSRMGAGGTFSLVMLDIDHFKAVNDRYGHPVGDAVLRWLGKQLRADARRSDFVARYGGEEFAAILTETSSGEAVRWAERLRNSVQRTIAPGVGEPVTVSIGVAACHPGESGSAILERADRALYAAKRAGRDRVISDEPSGP